MDLEASDRDFAALIAGQGPRNLKLPDGNIERPEILAMLRDLANSIRPDFVPAGWLIVSEGEIVGLCSLVKPPAGGTIFIGYGIAETRRRRGFASAGVSAVLAWARNDPRIDCVCAETAIDNLASQRVLERNGFVRTGRRDDAEDGEMVCWEHILAPAETVSITPRP